MRRRLKLLAFGLAAMSLPANAGSVMQASAPAAAIPNISVFLTGGALSLTTGANFGRQINFSRTAPLASINSQTGKLRYALYANSRENSKINMIPDFSYAGYRGGGVALPSTGSIAIRRALSPRGSGLDDRAAIQAAIDEVSALPQDSRGIRGAVLLREGTFLVSGTLTIRASGVILRGRGQGSNGTVLRSTSRTPGDILIDVRGAGSSSLPNRSSRPEQTAIRDAPVPVGSVRLNVADASGYAVNDIIAIVRTPNNTWTGPNGVNTAQFGWVASSYVTAMERRVVRVSGNTITFDAPTTDAIQSRFGSGFVYRVNNNNRLREVGIENLRVQTRTYSDRSRMDRATHGISFNFVQNSWVRDVTARHFNRAFTYNAGTRFNTMEDVAYIDPDFELTGGNRYGFDFNKGSQNVYQRCYTQRARHSFTSQDRVTGPNVFLDCFGINSEGDSGGHQRWGTGTLYDNVNDLQLRSQNRQSSGSGHGWAAAQNMFWNSRAENYIVQAPAFAMNYAVGVIGTRTAGRFTQSEPTGIIESEGSHVSVRSLYLQQLEDRLGRQAVLNVTIPAQRNGQIWNELRAWRGEGRFNP